MRLITYLLFVIFLFSQKSFASKITYEEILDNPSDLELNLNYAKQQESEGNLKLTIATLERLSMLYPSNTEIKLYLLSIVVKMDSPAKLTLLVQSILSDPNTTQETKKLVVELLDKEHADLEKLEDAIQADIERLSTLGGPAPDELTWPITGSYVSSSYKWRRFRGVTSFHGAIDIPARTGIGRRSSQCSTSFIA